MIRPRRLYVIEGVGEWGGQHNIIIGNYIVGQTSKKYVHLVTLDGWCRFKRSDTFKHMADAIKAARKRFERNTNIAGYVIRTLL